MRLLKDGHFMLERPSLDNEPATRITSSLWREPTSKAQRDLSQAEASVVAAVAARQGQGRSQPNATQWLALLALGEMKMQVAGPTEGPQLPRLPENQMPERNVEEQPEGWSSKAWSMYNTAYRTLAPLRGGVGNAAATAFAAMGADNCILKLAFILYKEDGEDDYPYMQKIVGTDLCSSSAVQII
eukprot:CAMPEP_0171060920 /NCGR_PEP_ID=MMETSP0766_2-20121228/4106_1 /TAXON_ID=439317 /ORGANISM="Gambierdiscus australes, Strain CAWD 149" /LENGTH=184 /DNA_ID=CAMNT_0011516535 /DNA_START=135 /DNA_END=690 /DNA_ORIENTATION=+